MVNRWVWDGFGNPATYLAGFQTDGLFAQVEISALDIPQQFSGEQIVGQLHQQLQLQMPQDLQPLLFADPLDRMIGLDAAALGPNPVEFVWGTTDLGMMATADLDLFSQLPPQIQPGVDRMFQDMRPAFGDLRGGGNLAAVPEPNFGLATLFVGVGIVFSRRKRVTMAN